MDDEMTAVEELDFNARAMMEASPGLTYEKAMEYALSIDPDLAQRYAEETAN
jgi:hypothetical protein